MFEPSNDPLDLSPKGWKEMSAEEWNNSSINIKNPKQGINTLTNSLYTNCIFNSFLFCVYI
jgi:hypothetical protein